jgi:murein DD-endopeptidase MepM/ murein hydrolase activator NlpD
VLQVAGMDDRRLTLIVVPHGDLETRTFEIPYGKLKFALGVTLGIVFFVAFVVASWFPVAAQASRVPALVEELHDLEGERARVVELAETLAMVEAQYERVREMLGTDGATPDSTLRLPPLRSSSEVAGATASAAFDWPLPVAGFASRSQEQAARAGEHPGLDIAVPAETQIRASSSGIVKEARQNELYGHYVLIDHGGGIESLYGQASRILVREGDRVARGQLIALAGSSSGSIAPHLHFEIRRNGRGVDPLQFVRQP